VPFELAVSDPSRVTQINLVDEEGRAIAAGIDGLEPTFHPTATGFSTAPVWLGIAITSHFPHDGQTPFDITRQFHARVVHEGVTTDSNEVPIRFFCATGKLTGSSTCE
jgi:hypothetical protein